MTTPSTTPEPSTARRQAATCGACRRSATVPPPADLPDARPRPPDLWRRRGTREGFLLTADESGAGSRQRLRRIRRAPMAAQPRLGRRAAATDPAHSDLAHTASRHCSTPGRLTRVRKHQVGGSARFWEKRSAGGPPPAWRRAVAPPTKFWGRHGMAQPGPGRRPSTHPRPPAAGGSPRRRPDGVASPPSPQGAAYANSVVYGQRRVSSDFPSSRAR